MDDSRSSLTRDEVRDVDRRAVEEYGMSSLVLMENAGRGAADFLRQFLSNGSVCVCCGKGNNGGDGFVIARHLEAAGIDVHVLLVADPDSLEGDALTNLKILQSASTPYTVLERVSEADVNSLVSRAEWIVDALLGTGIQGEVREPYAHVINLINAANSSVLAIDLPSGLDCDSGQPLGACIRADQTVTFVANKRGFKATESATWTGPVTVLPIGVPRRLLAAYNL